MKFPSDFPLMPPVLRFTTPMWHPNSAWLLARLTTVYSDGTLCISILHAPGNDAYGFESANERWLPVHGIESILVSVISLLSADVPNIESPANIDAAKDVRDDLTGYKRKVRRLVARSAEDAWD